MLLSLASLSNQYNLIEVTALNHESDPITPLILSSLLGLIHGFNPFMSWLFGLLYSLRSSRLMEGLKAVISVSIGHIINVMIVVTPLAYLTKIIGPPLILIVGLISVLWASLSLAKPRLKPYLGLNVDAITLTTWGFISASLHIAAIPVYPLIVHYGLTLKSVALILMVHYISFIVSAALMTCISYYGYNRYFRNKLQKLLLINYEAVWNIIVIIVGFITGLFIRNKKKMKKKNPSLKVARLVIPVY